MTKAIEAARAISAAPKKARPVDRTLVPAVEDMTDEIFLRHLERRHPEDLEVKFPANADGSPRTLATRIAFEALHALRHRTDPERFDHDHKEPIQRERETSY
jgi:hypothetical protein